VDALGVGSLAIGLAAKDTRNVVEPSTPKFCAILDAQLQSVGHSLAPADEAKLDTARIQQAIDKCPKGRGVLLHGTGNNNAFLSGPLQLKPGVILVVAWGVTLFASRDPALYAVSPGSCGLVNDARPGCKPSSPSRRPPAPPSWATASSTAAAEKKC